MKVIGSAFCENSSKLITFNCSYDYNMEKSQENREVKSQWLTENHLDECLLVCLPDPRMSPSPPLHVIWTGWALCS